MTAITAYIGLGSNLDDPRQQLQRALQALANMPDSTLLNASPFYRSAPLAGMAQNDYCNAVAAIATTLTARQLLQQLQQIENQQGRIRQQRWASRTLDLDLLLYDNAVIHTADLQVPHYALHQRPFVVFPLLDIAPDLKLPDGTALRDLAEQLSREGLSVF
ncbi:2-amino-4-hydroxy-6-hydroxymethyldihydropteridine diphosphokinase [Permianibacter aggregans]|uniref:2-amino-4-hydroxy-6-hydroxymethyldihydropteridine pyrophosphokinase n=1 Tax=Permianibacter aggregans TaxID=1510150 RepID=A0A4R6UK59_9GAMM|nr:2-amino-4-hydroxy-6-hydroxymethyldihydropteridine diphosphokinase [Permianibacter aggregans]QGX40647.1 2-amino-4-hydroxy-6-hydroxymethyldihydropteridine diphosphokinase [Permianibacter aggregans]TDQ46516.1 2-amino-4-hydroxy-6-hydroxymethyldihydropteridine diphosphokinase [Permianibacter aggregans]